MLLPCYIRQRKQDKPFTKIFFWIGAGKYRTKCWSSCKADYSVNAVKGAFNKFHGDANCIVCLAEKGHIQISSSMTKLEKIQLKLKLKLLIFNITYR